MKKALYILITTTWVSGCIGVDIVDDSIESNLIITNTIDTLRLGDQHEFSYRYTDAIGQILEITPDWSVSDDQIISVDDNGLVTPNAQGSAWVSVSYVDDQILVTDTTQLYIAESVARLEMINSVNKLRVSDLNQLSANYFSNLGVIESRSLIWESSDTNILIVDQNGGLEAISEGTVTVTVSDENNIVSQSTTILVLPEAEGEEVLFQNEASQIIEGEEIQILYQYYDTSGKQSDTDVTWSSSNEDVVRVSNMGVLSAVASGQATITVVKSSDNQALNSFEVEAIVDDTPSSAVRAGTITTTSSYLLEGEFSFTNIEGGIRIDISENYKASTALPQLVVYITNNPNTINPDVSLEVASVTVFEGAHSYDVIMDGLDENTYDYILYYCKPFAVKVGDGKIEDQ